jgi:hypothetical protein
MVVGTIKSNDNEKCKLIAGNFDHHADVGIQCGAHFQWSTSKASLDDTGCRNWASACATLPWRWPWLTIFTANIKTLTKRNFWLATYGTIDHKSCETLYSAYQCNNLRKNPRQID